ncbi:MAG: hypothetical protein Q8O40_11875, partial [Chloroflexota bacterium]|nr:hypothetical protein [Chloroflexota bacterium]
EETWQIFDAVRGGRSREELRTQMSGRHRTTIHRAFSVAKQFELRDKVRLDKSEAGAIVEAAGNSATEAYVEDLFRQWKAWKSERLTGTRSDDGGLDGVEEHPGERRERQGIASLSEVANAVAAMVASGDTPVASGSVCQDPVPTPAQPLDCPLWW